jgi:glutamate--cysteine ligase
MMRLTASQQLNLDLGSGSTLRERWLLANLISPLITAAFSTSPKDGYANARAIAWQGLDPTRSGYPALLVDGSSDDPIEQYADAALTANPMLFWTQAGEVLPGEPGFSFRDWLENGRGDLGYPTIADLEYHLTTLFLEVRPRGFFELRSCDALPGPWRIAPTVLLTGLIYCGRSRSAALDRLLPWRPQLPEMWRISAERGMTDNELASASVDVLQLGLEGAHRMPVDYFSRDNLAIAERFLETFTRRHRAPASELAERLAQGPAAALAWATGHADCESAV